MIHLARGAEWLRHKNAEGRGHMGDRFKRPNSYKEEIWKKSKIDTPSAVTRKR